jgi:hypothetical protein
MHQNVSQQRDLAGLQRYLVGTGSATPLTGAADVVRLSIEPGTASGYSDAQLDDYSAVQPFRFINRAPLTLTLRARFSHPLGALRGTAGFGLWNHPFGGGGGLIPRSAWFFYGSPESDLRFSRNTPGHGFKAALLDALPLWRGPSPTLPAAPAPTSAAAGTSTPNSALFRLATRIATHPVLLRPAISIAQRIFRAREHVLDCDVTEWHTYTLQWGHDRVCWTIDGRMVYQTNVELSGPLGLVIWIDNYRAAFSAASGYGFSALSLSQTQWLDVSQLSVLDAAHDFGARLARLSADEQTTV